jgi:hypothetical protein
VLAQELELTLRMCGIFVRPGGHCAGAVRGAEPARDLAVSGGEVVVPEERHLLLERPRAVDHAEDPPLPRVGDDGRRRELTARRHAHEARLPDIRVDVVGDLLVVDELVDGAEVAQLDVGANLGVGGAESRAAQQMLDLGFASSGHGRLRVDS